MADPSYSAEMARLRAENEQLIAMLNKAQGECAARGGTRAAGAGRPWRRRRRAKRGDAFVKRAAPYGRRAAPPRAWPPPAALLFPQ